VDCLPNSGWALIALAISPVEAREMTSHGDAVSRHVGARGAVSTHRGFARFGRSTPFGSVDDLGGFDDFGSPAPASEAPPDLDFIEPQPAPSKSAAELPPCREMTPVGVVIKRGTACSRVGGEILVKRRSESETDHGNVAAKRDDQARQQTQEEHHFGLAQAVERAPHG
jgi:hypothetical protein